MSYRARHGSTLNADQTRLSGLLAELERTPTKTACTEVSTRVRDDGRCTVKIDVTGRKGTMYSLRHPYGDEDVEDFLNRFCDETQGRLVLDRCRVTLNGCVFQLRKDMKIRELADDAEQEVPYFVLDF